MMYEVKIISNETNEPIATIKANGKTQEDAECNAWDELLGQIHFESKQIEEA